MTQHVDIFDKFFIKRYYVQPPYTTIILDQIINNMLIGVLLLTMYEKGQKPYKKGQNHIQNLQKPYTKGQKPYTSDKNNTKKDKNI